MESDTTTGKEAEIHTKQWLQQQGLRAITENYSCRFGEIDLIMLDGETLVFIEVRLRSHKGFGGAAGSVDYRKQRKIIATAEWFLSKHLQHNQRNCRFDVIAFETNSANQPPLWYKDAFII